MSRPTQMLASSIAALALTACDPCVDACEIRNSCGVDPEPVNCTGVCTSERKQSAASACEEPYEAWLDCRTGLDDLCAATGEECASLQGEYEACFAAFCDEDPAHEACAES